MRLRVGGVYRRQRRDGVVGYLRLHRQDYDDAMLAEWQARMAAQPWEDTYVFFKHDYIEGAGPLAVERFTAMARADSAVKSAVANLPSVERDRARV